MDGSGVVFGLAGWMVGTASDCFGTLGGRSLSGVGVGTLRAALRGLESNGLGTGSGSKAARDVFTGLGPSWGSSCGAGILSRDDISKMVEAERADFAGLGPSTGRIPSKEEPRADFSGLGPSTGAATSRRDAPALHVSSSFGD